MPTWLYHAAVYLHLLAALLWLGGMFFLAAVGAPVLRLVEPPSLRARLFHELGLRFRTVGWWALAVLGGSGLLILHLRGLLRWEILGSAGWWGSSVGRALGWKLTAVAGMVGVSALHDFVFGPRAMAEGPGGPVSRRRALLLARLNGGLGLILVYWAMRLARGG